METADADRLDEFFGAQTQEKQEESPKEKTETETADIALFAHMSGTVISLEDVEDETFAQKMLGDSVAIEPDEGRLYSPCEGTVQMIFDTKHAITLASDEGFEVILHIGIDTVKLGGKYFDVHVSDGQKVHKGDLLISFDLDAIRSEGYKTTTPLIICNTDDYSEVKAVSSGKISAGEPLVKII